MTTIKCEINGKLVEVEMEDSVASAYLEVDEEYKRAEWRYERKASRYGVCSIESMQAAGHEIAAPEEEEDENLEDTMNAAIKQLLPDQQDLIRRLYFNGESQTAIAAELGVTQSAIAHRLQRALATLKKIIKKS